MAAENFAEGEYVNITIKGARVKRAGGPGFTIFDIDGHGHLLTLMTALSAVSVERIAPPEWPPQPGDLWRDGGGELWFAARHWPNCDDHEDSKGVNSEGWRLVLVPPGLGESGAPMRPEHVVQPYGPFALVRREAGEV